MYIAIWAVGRKICVELVEGKLGVKVETLFFFFLIFLE